MSNLLKAVAGRVPKDSPSYMDLRDRLDFVLLFIVFGVLATATSSWSNFGNQIVSNPKSEPFLFSIIAYTSPQYGPYGYTQSQGKLNQTEFVKNESLIFTSIP